MCSILYYNKIDGKVIPSINSRIFFFSMKIIGKGLIHMKHTVEASS